MSHDICHVQTNFTIDITEFTSSRDGDRDVYHPNTLLDDDQISAVLFVTQLSVVSIVANLFEMSI